MAKRAGMHPAVLEGLKSWASRRKTRTIAGHLEGKADNPKALAVWVRKQALGEAEFKEHQRGARKGKR